MRRRFLENAMPIWQTAAHPFLHEVGENVDATPLDAARCLASRGSVLAFLEDPQSRPVLEAALRVRAVETKLLELFGKGKLHGTIHTCVGQELTGILVGQALEPGDFVTSNHRCHGHFIGATGNWRGLVDEIIGNAAGVCAGIGSSQHLYAPNFISNGQQGGLLPVASGVALDRKRAGGGNLAVSFIGEGTLGEGIVYETLNLDSLWSLPHLIVCENNFYSQSTPQPLSVAGDIAARAAAFGIRIFVSDTWDVVALSRTIEQAMRYVRENTAPAFLLVRTYRLNPHSKGDDPRDPDEIRWFSNQDPLSVALEADEGLRAAADALRDEVSAYAEAATSTPRLAPESYLADQLQRANDDDFVVIASSGSDARVHQQLNAYYRELMATNENCYFIGEDIADPYGGAFKIAQGLTTRFPERALTTPISEAAIVGLGIGLAISGNRPLVEVMFGDFMTYTFDQIVNNASKIFHMYNRNLSCPVVVRTPMGGGRGYGPTHSQSLERFFIGIDNCLALGLTSILPVQCQLAALRDVQGPALLFENKLDYAVRTYEPPEGFVVEHNGAAFPTARIRPAEGKANATIVTYGGMARRVADSLEHLFDAVDTLAEVIVPTSLHPLDMAPILGSVRRTGTLVVVEEGAGFASLGAEILAAATEALGGGFKALRIAGRPVPVPSVPVLEQAMIPNRARLQAELERLWQLDPLEAEKPA